MGFLVCAINEMLRKETFAHQAALHVNETYQNGVYLTC